MTKEELRVYHREWARKNRAKIAAKRKTPEHRAKIRAYRAKNRELFCQREAKWRRDHPEQTAAMYRAYRMKTEYRITEKRYQRLAATQGWLCVICDDKPNERGEKLVVDHDHSTGEVRGLICRRCNTGLGYFRDNPNFLRHAVHYLNPDKRRDFLVQRSLQHGSAHS